MASSLSLILVAWCSYVLLAGAPASAISPSKATCAFAFSASGVEYLSSKQANDLEDAVFAVNGLRIPISTPDLVTNPMERGMLVAKAECNSTASAQKLCTAISTSLSVNLPSEFGDVVVLTTSVVESSAKSARGKACYWYNWVCWIQCNRGYRTYSSKCCCK